MSFHSPVSRTEQGAPRTGGWSKCRGGRGGSRRYTRSILPKYETNMITLREYDKWDDTLSQPITNSSSSTSAVATAHHGDQKNSSSVSTSTIAKLPNSYQYAN
jgi:hypothetical protein